MASTMQRIVDRLLDGRLSEYVTERRAAGESWRQISLALHDDIGVDITYETLRVWFGSTQTDGIEQVPA